MSTLNGSISLSKKDHCRLSDWMFLYAHCTRKKVFFFLKVEGQCHIATSVSFESNNCAKKQLACCLPEQRNMNKESLITDIYISLDALMETT